ncbi:thiamine pyrophosphate-dependent dehydrogenase E1 component subunit alpha [bacterium]|nr:thiamine pyrophosphate-dependent dehydrogenase E1 component subunit alpha [bacterium]
MIKEKILPEKAELIWMYQKMYEIRCFEEKLFYLFLHDNVPGTMHQYIGEEAVAVGVCANLEKSDYITSTHRGHGHCIAKGASLDKMMAEMFAKKTGYCKGMGGSMHLADFSVGILGATGIVGAGIPIATGAGLSAKLRGTDQVTACFFGDGATNRGAFHEGVNMAAVWKLPVIFVCENNLYGFSTPVRETMLLENIADRAGAYGIPGIVVDGNDVLAVYDAVQTATERARKGEGPTLVECKTYRYKGHARFEPAHYRSKEEVKEWQAKDPIPHFRDKLIEMKVLTQDKIKDIEEQIEATMEDAVKFAKNSPAPDIDESFKYIYA